MTSKDALGQAGLAGVVSGRSLVVVTGPGGVGKTTVSAGLGVAATAHVDGDILIMTIDPARRLASALGIEIQGNEPVEIKVGPTARGRRHQGQPRVFAAMLDPAAAWDELVRAEADQDVAKRLLANPVYRRIADTFVHGNDYAALGWLESAISSGRFGLIIVDTPPSQNALDFFDAPQRVEEFFSSSLLSWLTGGADSFLGNAAAKTFASLADSLLGAAFFADVVEFFQLMGTVVPGMVERTSRVAEQLSGHDAALVAVLSPAGDVARRLDELTSSLASRGLGIDAVIANGVEPEVFANPNVADLAERLTNGGRTPFSAKATSLLAPGAEYVAERCGIALAEDASLAALEVPVCISLPRLVRSPTTIDALRSLGERLWTGDPITLP